MKDLSGQVFGRLTVISPSHRGKRWVWHWNCICECGTARVVSGGGLSSGDTQSCGCLRKERTSKANSTHGKCASPTYKTWTGITQRCTNPKDSAYPDYGGRGISVCERWLKFENFLADMGERPEGLSLDRKDNNGNYEKDNCRWATRKGQARNRRSSLLIEYQGKTQCLAAWCEELGLKYHRTFARLTRLNWSIERSFT